MNIEFILVSLSVATFVMAIVIYRQNNQIKSDNERPEVADGLHDILQKFGSQDETMKALLAGVEKNAATLETQLERIDTVVKAKEAKPTDEGLDQMVKERTQKLQQKRLEIAEYAFINSSKMRAPMATILGLISVLELGETENGQSMEEMVAYLKYSVERLDKMLNDMNETLGKEFYEDNSSIEDKEIVLH